MAALYWVHPSLVNARILRIQGIQGPVQARKSTAAASFLWPLSAHLVKPIFQLGDSVIFQERNEQ